MLTIFAQLSRSFKVRRKLIPQMRSLVSERIVIISIIIGWLSETVIAVLRWPVRDIAIFFFLKLSHDKLKLSRDKMSSYRAINEKI